jgi:hypothetical protein
MEALKFVLFFKLLNVIVNIISRCFLLDDKVFIPML